ncbi:gamma carbonic anhydrase family protein [Lentilitoribacter sp. EG35]|jgi:carbonic anhydrase/acetyltransferase-like protein (isoleucine patch superfamily)|uniref:gamma carbonic anhydrase family protein n=1 Tax=Lentilitoribacter sp. EG35 TaxID=3234192 RepID=UPI0034606ADA
MAIYSLDGIEPKLPIEGKYWIADSAEVIGRISVSRDVGIWFGAVLRGDNEWINIGEGSNIQENCTLHTDMGFPLIIGNGCTIGHNAILHGCELGDNTLIGMGATILNGAKIGSNCIVGAGALVTEGKVIPDNSLVVGAPARVVREIDEVTVQSLKDSAHHYVENAYKFRSGLTRLK